MNIQLGAGANTLTGTFKTAPEAGNKDSFTFNYIVDPQISNAENSIAVGATFNELSKLTDSAFTYIGGDLTDSHRMRRNGTCSLITVERTQLQGQIS